MSIFVSNDFGDTIPIDMSIDMTLLDVAKELPDSYKRPVFSYQDVDMYDLSQSLADLGICNESIISIREYNPSYMYSSAPDGFKSDHIIIIDTELKLLHIIIFTNTSRITTENYKLILSEENVYKVVNYEDYVYDMRKRVCEITIGDNIDKDYYYPRKCCDIYGEVADNSDINLLINSYPQFDINIHSWDNY